MKKKQIILIAGLILSAINVSAQGGAPKREVVVVGKFTTTGNVNSANAAAIRQGVITGFTTKGRFDVIDEETNSTLNKIREDRKQHDVTVTADNVTLDAESTDAMKSLGAQYYVVGNANNYSSKSGMVKGLFDSKEKLQYTTIITFTLKAFDMTGAVVGSNNIELMGLGATQGDSEMDAIKDVSDKMERFVNTYFPFETRILQIEKTADKKGKKEAKELYIHCGSNIGVKKNDAFVVLGEISIGGIKSTKEIGKLKVIEVTSDEISKCSVTKGGVEINDAANKDGGEGMKTLIVRSLGQGGFWDTIVN